MAVIVQELVDARVAGVMFTQHPRTGDRSLVVIESSYGLGEAVVGGEVTPDLFEVNRITRHVHDSRIGAKPFEHRLRAGGRSVLTLPVDDGRQRAWSICEEQVMALLALARDLETKLGRGLDVEWAIGSTAGVRGRGGPVHAPGPADNRWHRAPGGRGPEPGRGRPHPRPARQPAAGRRGPVNAPPQTGTEAIAAVATSAASVSDVVAGCLEKVRELDGAIGAFRVIDGDAVRSRAKELDDRVAGPLQGLVVGVKDVIDTADLPTAYGSPLFSDHRPSADADVVAALRRAGALVLGKTESTEFALFHPTRTRNPVDDSRTPGGSSSGSAAAVAAGMVPVALGTQTAGSVVRPAAYCGVYGFKPSRGWASTAGIWLLSEQLDTVGLFARCAADLMVLYGALQARPTGTPHGDRQPPFRRLPPAVAVLATDEWDACDQEVHDALRFVAGRLSGQGWDVREMQMPPSWRHLPAHHGTVMSVEVAKNLRARLGDRVAQISESAQAVVEQGRPVQRHEVPRGTGGAGGGARGCWRR